MILRGKSYIKLQDHEKRKTRAYQADIGKYYNMSCAVLRMSITTSAMMGGNCGICDGKQDTGWVYPDL